MGLLVTDFCNSCVCFTMTKLQKQRKKKKYNYGRNRSRVRKQQERTTKFNVKVDCKAMKDVWDHRISVKENMASMGVVLNAKEVMPASGTKKKTVDKFKVLNNKPLQEKTRPSVIKPEVIQQLEAEANVKAKQNFRFTPTQVQPITYMMDKHGMDFKAMARDPKNHYQETPAKLKGMVTKFISIPEHYALYCKERGLMPVAENRKDGSGDKVDGEDMDDEAEEIEVDHEKEFIEPDGSDSDSEIED